MFSKGRIGDKVKVAGIVGLMVFAVAAVQAQAAPFSDVTVRYSDLNLNTAQGAETLYVRITAAASEVCPGADSLALTLRQAARRCERAAVAQAVATVSSPKLAAVYAERSHHGTV